MSTVTEIREAISKLSPEDQSLLAAEIFATIPLPHESDPAFLAAIDEGLADAEAGRVYSIEEVRTMSDKWISESSSRKEP
jgi:predicted transcriptional regulator